MSSRKRENLIYALVLLTACSLAVALMATASWIDRVLP
jgi:hypothetical protein